MMARHGTHQTNPSLSHSQLKRFGGVGSLSSFPLVCSLWLSFVILIVCSIVAAKEQPFIYAAPLLIHSGPVPNMAMAIRDFCFFFLSANSIATLPRCVSMCGVWSVKNRHKMNFEWPQRVWLSHSIWISHHHFPCDELINGNNIIRIVGVHCAMCCVVYMLRLTKREANTRHAAAYFHLASKTI